MNIQRLALMSFHWIIARGNQKIYLAEMEGKRSIIFSLKEIYWLSK